MQSNIVEKTAKYFKEKGVVLPTISELRNPHLISDAIKNKVLKLDKEKSKKKIPTNKICSKTI